MILEDYSRRIKSAVFDDLRNLGIDLFLQPVHPSTVNGQLGKATVRIFLTTEFLKELLYATTHNRKWLGSPSHHRHGRFLEKIPDATHQRIIIDSICNLLRLKRKA